MTDFLRTLITASGELLHGDKQNATESMPSDQFPQFLERTATQYVQTKITDLKQQARVNDQGVVTDYQFSHFNLSPTDPSLNVKMVKH